MFGISFSEFLVIIVLLVVVTNPKDIPGIAKKITKYFYKAKNMVSQARNEMSRITQDMGLEDIKREVEIEMKQAQEAARKTTIIDIYGNEHEVYDVEKIRGDLAKEDLQAEIEKYNEINQKTNPENPTQNQNLSA
jgi:Sec-independent protein translocase protein TatA